MENCDCIKIQGSRENLRCDEQFHKKKEQEVPMKTSIGKSKVDLSKK